MRKIMVRAHALAKQMEGDYQARLALGLRMAWAETKNKEETEVKELTGSPKQIAWAEDIRAMYAKRIPALMEAVEIMKDFSQREDGRYVADLEGEHHQAILNLE